MSNLQAATMLSLWFRVKELFPGVCAATLTLLIQDEDGKYKYISNTFPKEEKK
tara:strand:- start:141 stop:299 length:159 start_codon:yes stop_codon:yes gene_type:complete